ncbi:HNH endonuclease [Chryseobacterium culicis]|uniref:HNH endonuclease n=1 Tax=Chryseobacterium culicis TaxID=680127 RepID=A0A1H6H719_CHRCI|nr:HNH endonuclease [Chryseobacterium culicis]SEH31559.1 HNH endonuclease [Chryseobacterium culicis]
MNCRRCKNGLLKHYYETEFHDIFQCKECQYQEIVRFDECCRDPFKIVVNDNSFSPNFRLYDQCKNCGGTKRNFPLKYTKDIEIRGEFDMDYYDQWKNNISHDKNLAYESVSYSNYLSSPRGKYHEYLESQEWKVKRKQVFDRDNNLCQRCKKESALHVHHLTYDNIFKEKLEDLMSVCPECHSQIHYEELISKIENLKNNRKI